MCITKEVSLSVFIICSLSCIYLYQRNLPNDRWVAILYGYIGIMQLLEYFMWKDQECSGLNQKATKIAFYILVFQPIISFLVAYIMTNGKLPNWLYMITMIYIIYVISKISFKDKDNKCTKPCDGADFGLSWSFMMDPHEPILWIIFFIALTSPQLLMKKSGKIYFILNLIIWLLSGMIGSYRCQGIIDIPVGSFWCLIAFLMPLFKIYYP